MCWRSQPVWVENSTTGSCSRLVLTQFNFHCGFVLYMKECLAGRELLFLTQINCQHLCCLPFSCKRLEKQR